MAPVYIFTAWSGVGKTSYLEKLIEELTRRGVRVGAVKHDAHEFEIDKPGKDSWRMARAGAAAVAISSGTKCAVMEYAPVDFAGIISRMPEVDIILCEGWHASGEGKLVLLYRSDSGKGLKVPPQDCAAVVSDVPLKTGGVPLFPLNDVTPMADFLCGSL